VARSAQGAICSSPSRVIVWRRCGEWGPEVVQKYTEIEGCFRYLCIPVRSGDLWPAEDLGGLVFIMAHWARKSNSLSATAATAATAGHSRHRQAAGNHAIKTKQIQPAARRWKREPIGSRIGMESTVRRISGGLCSIQNLSGHESAATESGRAACLLAGIAQALSGLSGPRGRPQAGWGRHWRPAASTFLRKVEE
jgi:hypothetical protein